MPGETEQTLAETVSWVHALPQGRGGVRGRGAGVSGNAARPAPPRRSRSASCAWGTGRSIRWPTARSGHHGPSHADSMSCSGSGRTPTCSVSAIEARAARPPRPTAWCASAARRPGLGGDARRCRRCDPRDCAAPSCRSRSGTEARQVAVPTIDMIARGRRRRCRAAATRSAGVRGDGCDEPAGAVVRRGRGTALGEGAPGGGCPWGGCSLGLPLAVLFWRVLFWAVLCLLGFCKPCLVVG